MSRPLLISLTIVGIVLVIVLSGWGWVLLAPNSLDVPIAQWLPWPVVCSTRGCITTWSWQRQLAATQAFAKLTNKEQPTAVQALSTLTRQHLAHYGQLVSPVTDAATVRYREEILNATDEAKIKEATGLSMAEYDELVIKPFLEQESLRQQRRAESAEDLYQELAQERWIFVLPWHLTWDKQEGKVEQK